MIKKLVNYLNYKWNSFVYWTHDITTRWGVGHTTVWFCDACRWDLSTKWQLIGGKTHNEYMLEHELYMVRHEAQYYANLAYDYQWALIEAMPGVEEDCVKITEIELTKTAKELKDV